MISDIRRRKLEKVFTSFDPDQDGVISRDDLTRMAEIWCRTYGMEPGSTGWQSVHEHADRWWADFVQTLEDATTTTVTREDWLESATRPAFPDFVENAAIPFSMAVFEVADDDRDGRITVTEMMAAQSKSGMSENETRAVFEKLDQDQDGFVTGAEYVQAARDFYLSDDPHAPGNLIAGRL